MGAINWSGLTFNKEEARSISEVVFEVAYNNPAITDINRVESGIKVGRRIPIFGLYGKVGKKVAASCAMNDEDASLPTSEKEWSPVEVNGRLSLCKSDIPSDQKIFATKLKPLEAYDLEGDPLTVFIEQRLIIALEEMMLRLIWFADEAADVIANGGYLTAGTDKAYYTMNDGLWIQMFDSVTAGDTNRYTITENAGASYVAQDNLADDAALKVLRGLYNLADVRLKNDGNSVFVLTQSLYDNWVDYLEDTSKNFTLDNMEKGSRASQYRGRKIVVMDYWDRTIRADQDNGTKYNLPHRAILTSKDNIPVGTPDAGEMTELDVFYQRKDKKVYMDFASMNDAKLLTGYMTVVAY